MARRHASLTLVRDAEHYPHVITEGIERARVSVWIGTANVKDVRIEAPVGTRARARGRYVSLLESLRDLAGRGVDVRILHGAPPSRPFADTLRRLGGTKTGIQLRQCIRVHFKMIAVDGGLLYMGSANLTGAGLGAKGDKRRNFEAGIVTDDEHLLDEMQATFAHVWSGDACSGCGRRTECPVPIDTLKPSK
jgi:phosphatidylserine/phosphatidylglycerophosphate/cardiolipin synthase-like enzyme